MAITNSPVTGVKTLLTVPAGKNYAVTTIIVCNTFPPEDEDTNDGLTTFDLHLATTGQPISSPDNMLLKSLKMPAGETFVLDTERLIMGGGDQLVIVGYSPENLTVTVSYLEI